MRPTLKLEAHPPDRISLPVRLHVGLGQWETVLMHVDRGEHGHRQVTILLPDGLRHGKANDRIELLFDPETAKRIAAALGGPS